MEILGGILITIGGGLLSHLSLGHGGDEVTEPRALERELTSAFPLTPDPPSDLALLALLD